MSDTPEKPRGPYKPKIGGGSRHAYLLTKHIRFLELYLRGTTVAASYQESHGSKATNIQADKKGRLILNHPLAKKIVKAARGMADEKVKETIAEYNGQAKKQTGPGRRWPPKSEKPDPPPVQLVQTLETLMPAMQVFKIEREAIAQGLARMGFVNIRDIVEWDENGVRVKPSEKLTEAQAFAITEVNETVYKDGKRATRIKLADKRAALMDLAKLLGLVDDGDEPPPPPAENAAKRAAARQELMKLLQDAARPEPMDIEIEADVIDTTKDTGSGLASGDKDRFR